MCSTLATFFMTLSILVSVVSISREKSSNILSNRNVPHLHSAYPLFWECRIQGLLEDLSMTTTHILKDTGPMWGRGTPLPPLSIYFLIFSPFTFSFLTYFLLLSIPSLSTRIVPLSFQAGGRRRWPNLGLVCVLLCNLCYLYSLVKMDCGVLFYLV